MEDVKNTETNTREVSEKAASGQAKPRAVPPDGGEPENQLQEDAAELEERLDRDLGDDAEEDDAQ